MKENAASSRYNYTVLVVCWLGWIAIYLGRSILAPVLPLLSSELGLTYAQVGLIESAYLVGYIVVKVPAGLVANRIGIKRTLVLSMVGYGVSTVLNFGAAGFAHLMVFRFLLGLFQGVHLPLANTLLSERFGERQGRAIGFHESGPNVGNTIAFPLAVTITSALGWRWAFLILGLPAFLLAGVATLVLRDDKKVENGDRPQPGGGGSLRGFTRVLVPMALAHATYNLCLRTLLIFIPSYLVDFRGMSFAAAGFVASAMPAAGIVAKVSSGFLAERAGRRASIVSAIALSGVFILSLVWLPSGPYLTVNLVALGLVLYAYSPVIYASVTSSLPPELKSMGLGAVTMVGNIVGALSTFIIGVLIDGYGYRTALSTIAVLSILASALIFVVMGMDLTNPD
ncbi:MFS transporter [Candidatus Bathyarchaeota archaeon]|nr:MFS transporter [Candidatus Bathyarchaeota archaeon]